MKKRVLSFCLGLVMSAAVVFAQADLQPLVTIKLNKTESVTLKQLKARCEVYKKQTGVTSFTVEDKKQILDSLIDEKLVLHAAAKAGMSLTDAQTQELYLANLANQIGQAVTEQEFASIVKQQSGLTLDEFFMNQLAMDTAEYKQFLKNQFIAQQYILSQKADEMNGIAASDKEIRDYYAMNKGNFFQSDILKVFLVVVPKTTNNAKGKASDLLKTISSSSKIDFDKYKAESRKADSGYQAGDMYISKNNTAAMQLGMSYEELLKLFEQNVGDISPVTETDNDFQFYVVRQFYPAKILELSDVIQPDSTKTVYEMIRDQITYSKQGAYFEKAVKEVTDSLRTPENFQYVKTGSALDNLLKNW